MKADTQIAAQKQDEGDARNQQNGESPDAGKLPRKLTLAQNILGAIKVLAIAAFVIAALWGLDGWTSGK